MQAELDYRRLGQRIRAARLESRLSQEALGALVGCSNNHISHIETGQTKVSLPMLARLAQVLGRDLNYFLLDTPYVPPQALIEAELAQKLARCSGATLRTLDGILDVLLAQQEGPAP